MALSITFHFTLGFRRLYDSGNTAEKLADNEVDSTGSRYSSTPFQSGKGIFSFSSIPHDPTDAYKYSILSVLSASPPPVVNLDVYFLFVSFPYPSGSTAMPSYVILDCFLPAHHFWSGIWCWCIIVFFRSTVLSMMSLSSMLFCVPSIVSINETGSPSEVLFAPLYLCVTIISRLN